MTMQVKRMLVLGGAALLMAASGAWAQGDVDMAKNKLLAKRAAEADAYRKLAETVYGLRIDSDTIVRDFVTESDTIRADVDTFVKGVRLGEPRWYEDLTCEVPAEVTVAKVITQLKEIHNRHYQGNRIKGTDFESIKQFVKKDIIKVVGMGAPRPDLPPGAPEGVEDVITPVPSLPEPTIPDLWKAIPPQARLGAVRAAELDAKRQLLERIKGLRLTSDTLVRDFVTEWDEIRAEAQGMLVGAEKVDTYYHADEPIVEVTCRVPVETVITTIQELHKRHYQGNRVKSVDIEHVRKQFKKDWFEATGMGVPNKKFMAGVEKATPNPLPDWSMSKITATGQGTDPAMDTPQGRLKAARAAELDAKRRLAEQIKGMQISSETLVRDFVTEYDEVEARLNNVLVAATIENTEWSEGVAEVTVSVPGMEVWSVFNAKLTTIRHGG